MASTHHAPIEEHPDLLELRAQHDRAVTTPRAQMIEALALITGLYLAASPWIAGFNGSTTLAITNLIAGIAYMLLLGGLGSSFERTHSMAWAAAVIGIWTCVAPWVVAGDVAHTRSIISNLITGAVATLLAVAAAMAAHGHTGTRRGGNISTGRGDSVSTGRGSNVGTGLRDDRRTMPQGRDDR
ncbi:SPW repeat protein [Streptomyces sp. NPDC001185]|uniref:SPW repeat protein n=1 Tax=Streptomyces sp. NPDC001185 TaxID=3154380 RepID=UPI0033172D00